MGPMINAYPDSIGASLESMLAFFEDERLKGAFESFYILPSLYNSDLDRGFSVIDYDINKKYACEDDLAKLKSMGIKLKLDFILNHASVQSMQFQDIIKKGKDSKYADFFIDWNKFWQGCGTLNEDGVIVPEEKYIKDMFFRKPGLPLLNVRMPDGKSVPYWNTFYQKIYYDMPELEDIAAKTGVSMNDAKKISEIIKTNLDKTTSPEGIDFGQYQSYKAKITELLGANRRYLGQMDLNVNSPLVWEFYEDTLAKLASYGSSIVRLDAFAYAAKSPGRKNFFNEPETWDILSRLKTIADKNSIKLLPEIHSSYEEKVHRKIAQKGYMTYDFFFPGLLIDALERKTAVTLKKWIDEILRENIQCVNMLGCHDGIPLLDLKGLLYDTQIQNLIDIVVKRGGHVKDLHGKKNMYYQVNAAYFSALGESEKRMVFARALQMFMPGKPQVWYLDLLAGTNDYEAVKRAGAGGHKEINRTNLAFEEASLRLGKDVVKKQIELIRLRKNHPAFASGAKVTAQLKKDSVLIISWQNKKAGIELTADFESAEYSIREFDLPE